MNIDQIIKWGAIGLGAIFILPPILNYIKGNTSMPAPSIPDIIQAGGTVTTTKQEDLPWWTFISPFTMLTAYGTRGTTTATYGPAGSNGNGGVPGGARARIHQVRQEPRGYYEQSKQKVIESLSKGYLTATPSKAKIIEQLHRDIPKTITVKPGVLQPSTIARLESRAKYGTFGGR